MEYTTGSDQAILFYNRIVELLLRETMVIRKSFSKWISAEERNLIINALEDLKCYPQGDETKSEIYIVKNIVYESISNRITVYANPAYYARLREPKATPWIYSRTYQSA